MLANEYLAQAEGKTGKIKPSGPAALAGMGWIFQVQDTNSNEQILKTIEQGSQTERFVGSPLMAEALAMRITLLKARTKGIPKMCIYSNCKEFVDAVASSNANKEIFGIFQDIINIIPPFSCLEFRYVSREKNMLANSLTKSALRRVDNVTS
ncbi:unnamed protein product [Arabis nemorensis]|uniref:RNase H type-1 domain-containing protein n=1 Tax=Arabis nemorensis TaxID=586526 RepID=A0A565AZZ8_9BRAS|nr:unnamed protein product [Arabis nemorensis]